MQRGRVQPPARGDDPEVGRRDHASDGAPLATVVIPTRNRPTLLLTALRSALDQASVSVQVVVVDDGSSHGTAAAIRSLDDPRVQLLRHDIARGVATARNVGASAAAGTWIGFLDDDDLWAPRKIVRQIEAADAAGAAWVYAGVVEIDAEGQLLGGRPPPRPDAVLAQLRSRNVMPAGSSNVLVRADVFEDCRGFDTALRHLADWDLWLRLTAHGAPACVGEPLVAYRLHGGQATLDPTGMLQEAEMLRRRHGADPNSIRRWMAWTSLREGNRRDAVAAYTRAAMSGDLPSLGRAAIAALHPRPTSTRRRTIDVDDRWVASARAWVDAAADR